MLQQLQQPFCERFCLAQHVNQFENSENNEQKVWERTPPSRDRRHFEW